MALILNIDTASKSTSVALAQDGVLLCLLEEHEVVSHASKLTPFIIEILEKCNKQINALNAVAIAIGPGSYTGLRIGLSTAKALCFALEIPLIAISSLEAMNISHKKKYSNLNKLFVSVMNSRKNEIYCSLLDSSLDKIIKPKVVVLDENFLQAYNNQHIVIGGNALDKVKPYIKNKNVEYVENSFFSAENMIQASFELYQKKIFSDLAYVEPEYLKPFITT